MYTFYGIFSVLTAVISVVLFLIYGAFIWHFWVHGFDEKRSDKIWLMVFLIALCVYVNGLGKMNLWLSVPSGTVLLLHIFLFTKRWREYAKDFFGRWIVLIFLAALSLTICTHLYFEEQQRTYAWEHADVYKVVRFETVTETEDDYITIGDEFPVSYKSGTVDVECKYVILSDGNAYCIEKNKGNQKKVYYPLIEDSIRVFNGKIVTGPAN